MRWAGFSGGCRSAAQCVRRAFGTCTRRGRATQNQKDIAMNPTWRIYLLAALVSCVVAAMTTLVVVWLAGPHAVSAGKTGSAPSSAAVSRVPADTQQTAE